MDALLVAVGLRMRKLRKEKGLSQEDLSLEADLDRTYISDIERGARNVSLKNLYKIARALDVNLSELLYEVDKDIKSDEEMLDQN